MNIWIKIKEGVRKTFQKIAKSFSKRTSTENTGEKETQDKDFIKRNFVFMRRRPGYLVSVLTTTLLFFLIFAMMVGVAGVGAFLGVARGYLDATPELDLKELTDQNQTSFIYDRNGNLVSEYYGFENRESVSIKEIPEKLQEAFIAIEDVRFRAHNGIDLKRFFGAVVHNLTNDSVQGGSTITQQLIKQTILTPEQSYKRKIQEMYLAMELEKVYDKDQILEAYLNMIPLGNSSYGVKAAAQDYFGKDLNELSLRECAMLAGITRNPWRYDPRKNIFDRDTPEITVDRTNLVLHEMYENGFISEQEYKDALFDDEHPANNTFTVLEEGTSNDYPMKYFLEYAVKEVQTQLMKSNGMTKSEADAQIYNGGLHIYTTLDTDIQASTEEAVFSYEDLPPFRNSIDTVSKNGVPQPQAAAVVMDHSTGEIRAIVGGKQPPTGKKQLNRVTSRLALGSAIKPLSVYGPFIELDYPGGIIFDNIPADIKGWQGTERNYPMNYAGESEFSGPVDVRTGIRKSLNVVAAQIVCERITPQYSAETLINLGFNPDDVTENPSDLALGTYGNSMIDVIGAYGTIANKGIYQEPISVLRVTDKNGNEIFNRSNNRISRRVFKESTTYILTDWMQDVVHGGTTSVYIQNEAGQNIPVAGKTGTNNDFRGCYFAGFTPDLVATVWIGHDDFTPEFKSGSTGGKYAAPLWKNIMTAAEKNAEPQNFYDETPADMGRYTICGLSGKQIIPGLCDADTIYPPVTEWFPKDARPDPEDPTQVCDMHVGARICTYSGYPAGQYCPEEAVSDSPMIVLPADSRYQLLTDEQLAQYLPGAVRSYEQTGLAGDPNQQQTCPLHDYDWWRREQRRGNLRSQADTLIGTVKAHMKSTTYGAKMTSDEKNDLKKLISQLNDLLDSGNKGPPPEGRYWTELPGFDPDATEAKMDRLDERDQEIIDRIDAELSTYHTLSIHIKGEGTVDGDGTYQQGDVIAISADPDTGWKFLKWVGPVDDSTDATTTITMGTSNISITAEFVEEGTSPSPSTSP